MFTGPERDRQLIRELIDCYGDSLMRRDEVAWAANWTEDAVWHIRGMKAVGKQEIVSLFREAMGGIQSVVFIASPGMIKVDGDRATGRTHTFEHIDLIDGPSRFQAGTYDEQWAKVNGRWHFASRSIELREFQQ